MCTEPFLGLAKLTAVSLGLDDLDVMVVPGPQPLGSRDSEELSHRAGAIAAELRLLVKSDLEGVGTGG